MFHLLFLGKKEKERLAEIHYTTVVYKGTAVPFSKESEPRIRPKRM